MQGLKTIVWLSALFMPIQVWAAPGFDLDLKELKKPSAPPAAARKSKPVVAAKKKVSAQPKRSVKPAQPPATSPAAEPAGAPVAPLSPSELALKAGDPCLLAERIAVAVARSVPAATLLNGLELHPVAAVSYGEVAALVTCGISAAEAYTYGRLLEEHQVELVNIRGDETAGQTARKVIDALALPYRIESDNASEDGTLTYLMPASQERQRPLRLTLQP
ncbi:hypothetical protein [Trichlorobacter lovleyi]|uniref:hypothetical protein n=1 Tax=Trichlorobacter lovleyi TaxID=313985 RepID=UPI0022401DE7|nr:hypothetical protein [Trichlorobacter lovleyi]